MEWLFGQYTVKSTDVALYFTCTVPGHCVGGQKVKIIPYVSALELLTL